MNQPSYSFFNGIISPDRHSHHKFGQGIVREIKALKTDNWHGPLYIAKDYIVIFGFIWLVVGVSWWFYPLALLMIGAHQRGISTILHDSAHGVLTQNKMLNFLLGTMPTAWLIFQRHYAYKRSHVHAHHPFLGRPEDDPDLKFFLDEGVFTPRSDRSFVWKIIILPIFGAKTWAYLNYLVQNRFQVIKNAFTRAGPKPSVAQKGNGWREKFDRRGFSLFWASVLVASWVNNLLPELILLWIIPYLTSFHIIGWFIEMSEHCSSIDGQTVNLHMSRNRRSRHIEKWLTAINNDHYHLDHHLDPTTPFWRLPEAHMIRMGDPVYAAHCSNTGGIFQSGPCGEPSILNLIRNQNKTRCSAFQS